ncbi:MAG: CHAP domain-containing protein [Candidatus Nomurabacteria bacterium]|jgi:surface antigen|nr:CHAP domain-containing protein [Candidatus Nomurabacteria bacterium]
MKKLMLICACIVVASVVTVTSLLPMPNVEAVTQADLDNIRDELNKIRNKINGYEQEAKKLAAQANTLNNKIALLKAEENTLMAQIELSQAEHDKLTGEIEATEKRINANAETIGYIITQYYYNEEVTPIERLASSENFSSFVDEEARLSNLADNMTSIIVENKALKAEKEKQKAEVKRVLDDLNDQKAELVNKRAEQQRLLEQTKGQEAAYQNMKGAANSEKAKLEAEQQRILEELAKQGNASGMTPGDPNKGGYPYSSECPAAKYNGTQRADKWGMYTCECVSYAAWKVDAAYGNMPYWGGKGNASQWLSNARNAGIPTSSVPKVGAVGVTSAGPYGHVVWVEAVSGNRVYVSQYNYAIAAIDYKKGEYSEMWVSASTYNYIYFGNWN